MRTIEAACIEVKLRRTCCFGIASGPAATPAGHRASTGDGRELLTCVQPLARFFAPGTQAMTVLALVLPPRDAAALAGALTLLRGPGGWRSCAVRSFATYSRALTSAHLIVRDALAVDFPASRRVHATACRLNCSSPRVLRQTSWPRTPRLSPSGKRGRSMCSLNPALGASRSARGRGGYRAPRGERSSTRRSAPPKCSPASSPP